MIKSDIKEVTDSMDTIMYINFIIDNGANKIIIKSEGELYPNDLELYLRELQKNIIIISSSSLYIEFKGPVFLKSDMEAFYEDLKSLILGTARKISLESSEEEITLTIKSTTQGYSVFINFKQNNYKKEKWAYTTTFLITKDDLNKALSSLSIKF